jgi:hypothetical protein
MQLPCVLIAEQSIVQGPLQAALSSCYLMLSSIASTSYYYEADAVLQLWHLVSASETVIAWGPSC